MRATFLFLLILFTPYVWGQTYTSPFTQYFPSGKVEIIDRTIEIDKDNFTIITDTEKGKDIQKLKIIEVEKISEGIVYKCTSLDGLMPTIATYYPNNEAPYISILQPNTLNTEIRLLLD